VARNDVRLTDILKSAGGITDNAYMKGATLKRKYTKEQIEQRIQAAKQNAKMMGDKDKLSDEQKALLASSKSIGASMEFDPNTGTTKDNSNKVEGIDEYYQVAIDLTKALEYPDSYHDIILQNGDIINVPQYNYTVRVS
jgi:protein involved in polysaccharide export with SLBB domain